MASGCATVGCTSMPTPTASVPPLRTLEAACAAAEYDVRFDRTSLTRLQATGEPTWDVWQRAGFVRLLRSGARRGAGVRGARPRGCAGAPASRMGARPLAAATERVPPLHRRSPSARSGRAVRAAARRGRGAAAARARAPTSRRSSRARLPPSRAAVARRAAARHRQGACPATIPRSAEQTADRIVRRMGFDSEAREIVPWLVRNHLLMAEVATRRDLSDASVADNVAASCSGDAERLRLLYLLTIGDSKATGPAAWNPSKAALVRDLFVKAAAAIERGEAKAVAADRRDALRERLGDDRAGNFLARLPEQYVLAFDVDTMCMHEELLARITDGALRAGRRRPRRGHRRRRRPPRSAGHARRRAHRLRSRRARGEPVRYHRRPCARRVPRRRPVRSGRRRRRRARHADDRARARGRDRPRGTGRRTASSVRADHEAARRPRCAST